MTNQIELSMQRKKTWRMYHIPGTGNLNTLKINAIFISAANSLEHEMEKFKVCYSLKKEGKDFITEAELNKNSRVDTGIRRDVVCLDDGSVWEFETEKKKIDEKKETQKGAKDYDKVNWIWIGKKSD